MPFEIISGVVGATIGELLSKFLPARKVDQTGNEFLKKHQHRDKRLYRGLVSAFFLGFATPFALCPPGEDGRVGGGHDTFISVWFSGTIFGLPFFAALAYMILVWIWLGKRRAGELLIYFEAKQKTNILVFCFMGAVLAPIGIVSLLFLCHARMLCGS